LYFSAADLYVFPSRHESYGLTLMEAFQYGLPAITLENATMRPAFGVVSKTGAFARDLQRMSRMDLAGMGQAAEAFARENSFSRTAGRLASILTGLQSK
jgi:glycosyltransferase involved in cell wall biosynthesis